MRLWLLSWVFMSNYTDREVWNMLVPKPFGSHGFFHGPKGVGVYSKPVNPHGDYTVRFYRPAGRGARTDSPEFFKLVDRLCTRRKSKGTAMDRAYFLAHGRSRRLKRSSTPRPSGVSHGPNRAFCAKEKKHVVVTDWVQTKAKNDREMLVGHCPSCGTQVQKFGSMKLCSECGNLGEFARNDYICKLCREAM
jgi:hypothetical protein